MLLPSSLLRSCIHVGPLDPRVEHNLTVISREDLGLDGVDAFLVEHLLDMYDTSHVAPTLDQVRDWCLRREAAADARGSAALARLEGVPDAPFLDGTAFQYAVRQFREDVKKEGLGTALMEASAILSTGLPTQVKKPGGGYEQKVLHGPDDAIDSLLTRLGSISRLARSSYIEGEIRSDVERFKKEMARRLQQGEGIKSGITAIDKLHHGWQPGELIFILGFTSHNKSTFCFNVAYNAAVDQRKNVAVVSLEMSAFALQKALMLMHCGHPKWEGKAQSLNISSELVMTGMFTEKQAKFFSDVMDDLANSPDYGRIYYREAQSSVTVTDIQRWAEKLHRETPIDLLVIDYLGLVDLGATSSGMEQSSYLNRVVRQTKLLANSFANGRGIPILSPFQANREGYKDAEKNGGRYKLTAMAWANEAEKSADKVYYTYLDEGLRATNELILGNLKNRDGELMVDQVRAYANPKTRRIEDLAASADAFVSLDEDGGTVLDL